MKKDKGFILIFTFVLFSLISLLVLGQMKQILVFIKVLRLQSEQQKKLEDFEKGAIFILNSSRVMDIKCRIASNDRDPNMSIKQLRLNLGCPEIINDKKYYYLIQDLGEYPCLKIYKNKKIYGSKHFLLSMREAITSEVLQIRYAQMSKISVPCIQAIKLIHEGLLNWRYLAEG